MMRPIKAAALVFLCAICAGALFVHDESRNQVILIRSSLLSLFLIVDGGDENLLALDVRPLESSESEKGQNANFG
jgi:hypothetical protein